MLLGGACVSNKVHKILFGRIMLVSVFILQQVGVMLASILWLSEYRQWVHVLLTTLSIITIIYLIHDRTNASYKIAWIILILAFPVAGISIYLTFGGRRLSRPVRQRIEQGGAGAVYRGYQTSRFLR